MAVKPIYRSFKFNRLMWVTPGSQSVRGSSRNDYDGDLGPHGRKVTSGTKSV